MASAHAEPPAPARAEAPEPHGLRVLVTEWRLTDDGAARSSLRLVARWQRSGADVRLLALSRGGTRAPLPPGVVPSYPTRDERRLRHMILPAAAHLLRAARESDVIVAGREIGFGMLAARLAALLTRRPFVVIVRSEPLAAIDSYIPPRWQKVNQRALAGADAVICISEGLAPAVREAGVDPDAIEVVLNGVEIDDVTAAGRRPPGPLPEGEGPLVVGVGRVERQKGFDVLIRAHAHLMSAGRAHRLLILGEGRDRPELQRLACELGVGDSVHLPGHVTAPLPYIAAADLFCLPSRWEGFGQSLAEAMLLGTPVVAADCVSGPRELLAGGLHGDLVPVDDADALAVALRRHLDSPERLRRAACRGQEWALEHLDVDRTAAGMLGVLRRVAETRSHRRSRLVSRLARRLAAG